MPFFPCFNKLTYKSVFHQNLSDELSFVGFEVLAAVTVVWDVASYSLVDFYGVSEDLTALLAYSETSGYL